MLERPPAAIGVALMLGHDHREHRQQVDAGPDRHQVARPRRPAGDHAHLAHARAGERGRQRDARGQALSTVSQAPHPEALGRVQPRAAPSQRADGLEDGGNARPLEREAGEPLVDVVRELDLRELGLQAALHLAALEDPGHLAGDGADEGDVVLRELAELDRLHVQDAHQSWSRLDRD